MRYAKACVTPVNRLYRSGPGFLPLTRCLALIVMLFSLTTMVEGARAQDVVGGKLIPILGITREANPTGTVAYLVLSFEKRTDEGGLAVHFKSGPGRFSQMAQTSTEQAIYRTARTLGVSPDSWTVMLSVPYQGVTLYGESLSAMVALSVVALAQGDVIPRDRVITGTVTPDGHIGPVGGIPLKVAAANQARMRMVLLSDKQDAAECDGGTASPMKVTQVESVSQAYQALTAPLVPNAETLLLVSDERRY